MPRLLRLVPALLIVGLSLAVMLFFYFFFNLAPVIPMAAFYLLLVVFQAIRGRVRAARKT